MVGITGRLSGLYDTLMLLKRWTMGECCCGVLGAVVTRNMMIAGHDRVSMVRTAKPHSRFFLIHSARSPGYGFARFRALRASTSRHMQMQTHVMVSRRTQAVCMHCKHKKRYYGAPRASSGLLVYAEHAYMSFPMHHHYCDGSC